MLKSAAAVTAYGTTGVDMLLSALSGGNKASAAQTARWMLEFLTGTGFSMASDLEKVDQAVTQAIQHMTPLVEKQMGIKSPLPPPGDGERALG